MSKKIHVTETTDVFLVKPTNSQDPAEWDRASRVEKYLNWKYGEEAKKAVQKACTKALQEILYGRRQTPRR